MHLLRFRERQILLFVSITGILGLIARIYLWTLLPTNWDTGHYLYWGKLVLDGKIPFKDFFARHPVYVYLLAFSMKIFGYDISAAVMISIIASFLTMFVLYEISHMLYNRKTGLIASIIYAFAPTILTYSTVSDEKSIALLFVSVAIAILIRALETNNSRFFLLFGGVLGFSVYIHKAVGIYLLVVPLLLAYIDVQAERKITYALRKTFVHLVYVAIGFCIPAVAIYVYYGLMTNFQWAAYALLGLGGQQESIGYFMLGDVAPLTFRFRIFHVAIREWLYVAVPTAIFVGMLIDRRFKKSNSTKRLLIYILGLSLLVILVIGDFYRPQTEYGAYEPDTVYMDSFFFTLILLISLTLLLFPRVKEKFNRMTKIKHGNAVMAYWFLSTSLLTVLYGVPFVNHYYWLAPVMTIMAATVLRITVTNSPVTERSVKSKGNEHKTTTKLSALFIVLMVLSAGITASMLMSTPMTWRNQSVNTLHEVADYIREHTNETDEIMTDDPVIALLADRREALNVMPYLLYGKEGTEPFDPLPYDPFNLIPNSQEIIDHMEGGRVKYVVEAAYLHDVRRLHPMWNQTFTSLYVLETTIGGVSIYVFQH